MCLTALSSVLFHGAKLSKKIFLLPLHTVILDRTTFYKEKMPIRARLCVLCLEKRTKALASNFDSFFKQLFIYLSVLEIQTQQFARATTEGLFHLLKPLGQYFDFCIYSLSFFFSQLVSGLRKGESVWASFQTPNSLS